jgi:hypothetical protein
VTAPTHKRAIQNAWVVTDIEAAARRWSATLGIGPFHLARYTSSMFESLEHRGKPATLNMKTAIAFSGDIQIELIEPTDDSPSAYRDVYAAGETGFHHLCFWSDDIDADLAHYAALGCAAANTGKMRGGPRFAYIDARAQSGCMIELLEHKPALAALFDAWREANERWDGVEPIVRL